MFHFEENKHPKILKEYFKGSISIETLIIMDKIYPLVVVSFIILILYGLLLTVK